VAAPDRTVYHLTDRKHHEHRSELYNSRILFRLLRKSESRPTRSRLGPTLVATFAILQHRRVYTFEKAATNQINRNETTIFQRRWLLSQLT
jgi:hypothetical protein